MFECNVNQQQNSENDIFVKNEPISEDEEDEQQYEHEGSDEPTTSEVPDDIGNWDDYEEGMKTNPIQTRHRYCKGVKVRHCAYCYELYSANDLIHLPFSAVRRQQWIDILGDQLTKYMETHKHPFVCKQHFDPEALKKSMTAKNGTRKSYAKKPLPIADAKYEGRNFDDYRRCKPYTGERILYSKCCYCQEMVDRTKMKGVPNNEEMKQLWIRRLGDGFRKSIEGKTRQAICKSHFPRSLISDDGKVVSSALPIPLEDAYNDDCHAFAVTSKVGCKCVYCGKYDLIAKMVAVPEGHNRDNWCYELGERFAINLTKMEHLYICSSHFKEELPTKESIPFADKDVESNSKTETLPSWKTLYACTYCSGMLPKNHMVLIPMDELRLEEWCDLLGEDFEFNYYKKGITRLCKIHFRKEDFVRRKSLKIKHGVTPIVSGVLQRKKHQDIPTTKQCLYCLKVDKLRRMKRIVYDLTTWKLYVEVFGKEFEERFLMEKDNMPAVCRSHLNAEGTPLKYANLYDEPHMLDDFDDEPVAKKSRIGIKEEPLDENGRSINSRNQNSPGCSRETEDLGGLYRFGWANEEAMSLRHQAAVRKNMLNEQMAQKKKNKCAYCLFPIHVFSSHFTYKESDRPAWIHFGNTLGRQYLARLMGEETCDMGTPELKLCVRHISEPMNPVPDPSCLYAVDELLDHTYANFS